MISLIDSADEILAQSALRVPNLEDKSSWNSYVDSGVLGMTMPVSMGGRGQSIASVIATFEGLAYGGGDAAILFAMSAQLWSVQYAILRFGTAEQKKSFLAPMIRGELRTAHAATEPDAGSDIFNLKTAAQRCPGGYRLSGAKRYITSAPVADAALVFAATEPGNGMWGLSAFIVNLNAEGVSRSGNIPKMGLESAQFGDIRFDGCFVPENCRLGEEGQGATIFASSLDLERAFIMAPAIGFMRRELERSVQHANTRMQRGRTIGGFQSVSNRIADMALRLEASRLLIYHAAELKDSGRPLKFHSPIVKLALSESYFASSLDALRNMGASGYLVGDPASTSVRDAIGSLFYSGTSDVLRNLIASYAGVNDV